MVARPLALILLRVMGWIGLGEKGAMLFFSLLSFLAISLILLACEAIDGRPAKLHLRLFFVFIHHFQGASFGQLENTRYAQIFEENKQKYEQK